MAIPRLKESSKKEYFIVKERGFVKNQDSHFYQKKGRMDSGTTSKFYYENQSITFQEEDRL